MSRDRKSEHNSVNSSYKEQLMGFRDMLACRGWEKMEQDTGEVVLPVS